MTNAKNHVIYLIAITLGGFMEMAVQRSSVHPIRPTTTYYVPRLTISKTERNSEIPIDLISRTASEQASVAASWGS
jgi:hypothetical protein